MSSYRASDGAMQEMRYLSYGGSRFGPAGLPTARLYTGQLLDDSSGLYYYGARWYDSSLGRFISADSIVPDPSNPQSLNRYSYGLDNPLKYSDPTGHCVPACALAAPALIPAAPLIVAAVVVVGTVYVGYQVYEHREEIASWAGEQKEKVAQAIGTGEPDTVGPQATPPPTDVSEANSLPEFGSRFAKTPEEQTVLRLRPEGPRRSFSSVEALKRAVPTGDNEVLHHIVEQSQMNSTRMGFSTEQIQNTANVVTVSPEVNTKLNALYSSHYYRITGSETMTVREWLSTQSYEAQFDFGLRAIYNVQNGLW